MQSLFPDKHNRYLSISEEEIIERIPRTQAGLSILCKYLEENPVSVCAWQFLFLDFNHLIGLEKREKWIMLMRSVLDPETIRLTLGEYISADEFFPEEKAMILNTKQTTSGIQELLMFLKCNINCLYGWDIYFEKFYKISTPEQQQLAYKLLEDTFTDEFLRFRFPKQFNAITPYN